MHETQWSRLVHCQTLLLQFWQRTSTREPRGTAMLPGKTGSITFVTEITEELIVYSLEQCR
jgi:hypothetical protein